MDLQQQPHTLTSIRSLFLTQLWMNPNWKYPIGFISYKLQNRLPMDGEGDELQHKKNCQFLSVYFEDCFRAKFGARAFHFREGPVPTRQSTLHNLEGTFLFLSFLLFQSDLKSEWRRNIWRFFMQTKGLSFDPSAIFDRLHSSLLVSWQAPQITEGSIKDRPCSCTELSPGFTLITYSIEDGVF